jgi:lipopolysaccharide/colanic/teichoic acid biosynthesis glycosyltransferase
MTYYPRYNVTRISAVDFDQSFQDINSWAKQEFEVNLIQFYSRALIPQEIKRISHYQSLEATANLFKLIFLGQTFNDVRFMNKFLISANKSLDFHGLFILKVDLLEHRQRHIKKTFGRLGTFALAADFLIHRVFPKVSYTQKWYFKFTQGRNRAISRSEVLGRAYSCGFELVREHQTPVNSFFVFKKIKNPIVAENPTYGPLIRLNRIGQNGKFIKLLKFRTMHPYSEYIQEYIYKQNSLKEGGKFRDDFRVTKLGAFMRKFWLDELPSLINLIRGDIKLVGVRPISAHYFSLYTKELQELRATVKPGLIPPYYADIPKNMDEIVESELKYIYAYHKSGWITDLKYLGKIFYNIVIRRKFSS